MKFTKESLKIIYTLLSIIVIVTIPLVYSNILNNMLHLTFDNAFVSADVIAISPSYVSGRIKKIYAKDGDALKKGQLVALIDDTMYKAELEKNQSRLDTLKFKLNQLKTQTNSSDFRYLELEKEIEIAKQYVKMANLMLSYTRIASPINGVVAKDILHAGDSVNQSDTIMYIYRPSTLYIKAYIQPKYAYRLKIGMSVLAQLNGKSIDGKITKIGGIDVFHIYNKSNPIVPIKISVGKDAKKFLVLGMPVKLIVK